MKWRIIFPNISLWSSYLFANIKPMRNKGLALIVVLWIMMILEVVIGSFIYLSRLQTKIAGYHERELKNFALAKAGVERAIAFLYSREKLRGTKEHFPEVCRAIFSGSLVEGEYAVRIVNEESKLNINVCPREQLARLFALNEIQNKELLLDFIFKWRGQHKGFAALSQLLLGKSLNKQALEKIAEIVTIYGEGKININTAPAQVLEVLPGLNREKIQRIMDYRSGPDRTADTDDDQAFEETTLKAFLGQEIFQQLKDAVCYRAENFKITAMGRTEKKAKVIVAFLHYDWQAKTVKIKYWKEE